jgi:hypothetical protein
MAADSGPADSALAIGDEGNLDLDGADGDVMDDDPTNQIETSIEPYHPMDVAEEKDRSIPIDPSLGENDKETIASHAEEQKQSTEGAKKHSRQSSRNVKPVERFASAQYEMVAATPRRHPATGTRHTTSPGMARAKGASSVTTGKSSSPTTLGKSTNTPPSTRGHGARRLSLHIDGSKNMSPGSISIGEATSPEEEASLRVALQLQAEQFGLRNRRSAGSGG